MIKDQEFLHGAAFIESEELETQEKKVACDCAEVIEKEWLHTAANNLAFNFLNDPEEDIYTVADGKPFHD